MIRLTMSQGCWSIRYDCMNVRYCICKNAWTRFTFAFFVSTKPTMYFLPSDIRSPTKSHCSSHVTTGAASSTHAYQHTEQARSQFFKTPKILEEYNDRFVRFVRRLSPLSLDGSSPDRWMCASQLAQSIQAAAWSTE
ncbi:hypothetical protein MJO29_007143 [Puccinia striiformis f. sp. tritici]|nr:hypothetical protein MJO29_007143 [Puccinia striiformis f. sp. tritici]